MTGENLSFESHDALRKGREGLICALLLLAVRLLGQNFSGDMALSKVLIEDENWETVADGFTHGAAACSDVEGNYYFSAEQENQKGIFRLKSNGTRSLIAADTPGITSLAFGPDGHLYGCRPIFNEICLFDDNGKLRKTFNNIKAYDLAVTIRGEIFYTGEAGLMFVDASGRRSNVVTRMQTTLGICLTPDMGMLAVSEMNSGHVWAFSVLPTYGAVNGDTYMTLRKSSNGSTFNGNSITVDTAGRFYVATKVGLQMFDATGRISGVIAKPSKADLEKVAFAGPDRHFLYATCANAIYRRKTKARGVWHVAFSKIKVSPCL